MSAICIGLDLDLEWAVGRDVEAGDLCNSIYTGSPGFGSPGHNSPWYGWVYSLGYHETVTLTVAALTERRQLEASTHMDPTLCDFCSLCCWFKILVKFQPSAAIIQRQKSLDFGVCPCHKCLCLFLNKPGCWGFDLSRSYTPTQMWANESLAHRYFTTTYSFWLAWTLIIGNGY